MNLFFYGVIASALAGLGTGLGALPVLIVGDVSRKTVCIMLGGSAGVMLAATSFSLILPGIEQGNLLWPGCGVYIRHQDNTGWRLEKHENCHPNPQSDTSRPSVAP